MLGLALWLQWFLYCCKMAIVFSAAAANRNNKTQKVVFRSNSPFRPCISKINSTLIDSGEDLCIVILMYNLLEYSDNNDIRNFVELL